MRTADSDKQRLRSAALAYRRRLPGDEVEHVGQLLHNHLTQWSEWGRFSRIHTYVDALPGELPTRPLIRMILAADGRVTIPVIYADGGLRHSHLRDQADLRRGRMRLWEPTRPEWVASLADIDLILVPGAAFDHQGCRVGLGGGYYDRLLADLPKSTLRIGLIYDAWLLDRVPTQPHDQPVDMILTETGLHAAKTEDR